MLPLATAASAVMALPADQAAAVPPGIYAYVANNVSDNVSVIDTATNTVAVTIPVGDGSRGVGVTPDGTRVYVANLSSDTVSVIDTATNTVSVIDTATNTVTATVPVGNLPFGVAVTPDGTRAYVANELDDTVSVIDTATHTVLATVPVGTQPAGVAVTPDGTRAHVANLSSDTVSVIDTATRTVTATVPVGAEPFGVSVAAVGVVGDDPVPTELRLEATRIKGSTGSKSLRLTARLTTDGVPLEGENITFTADGRALCTGTTDTGGRATCTVPGRQDRRTCHTADYAGDQAHHGASATVCPRLRDDNEHDGDRDRRPPGPHTADHPLPPVSPTGV
ncbi:beta-propeller fold lactonase family protein [Streptomyces sp. NPDC019507]|uniref:YncE family protein n=1 Tax=Streptomyces sp. NPDC019507 TaxID=3154689 RepID=UPI003410EC5B